MKKSTVLFDSMKKHPMDVSIAIAEKPKAHAQRAAMGMRVATTQNKPTKNGRLVEKCVANAISHFVNECSCKVPQYRIIDLFIYGKEEALEEGDFWKLRLLK